MHVYLWILSLYIEGIISLSGQCENSLEMQSSKFYYETKYRKLNNMKKAYPDKSREKGQIGSTEYDRSCLFLLVGVNSFFFIKSHVFELSTTWIAKFNRSFYSNRGKSRASTPSNKNRSRGWVFSVHFQPSKTIQTGSYYLLKVITLYMAYEWIQSYWIRNSCL